MKLNQTSRTALASSEAGQTLAEVMVAAGMLGFMVVSLYAGFTTGFALVGAARENLRATQILEERMEVIRLVKWDDVAPGFIPTNFTAPFFASDASNAPSGGPTYAGRVTITTPAISETYSNQLRMIQIDLAWKSGNVTHQRQMISYVSQYGMQHYIY